MNIAKVKVNNVLACVTDCCSITSGMVGATVTLEYTDSRWESLNKTAVFTAGRVTRDVLNVDDIVLIPAEVLAKPNVRLQVGIYGTDAEGNLVIPTIMASVGMIIPGADPSGDESTDPELPIWAQLQKEVEQLKEKGVTDDQIAQAVADYLEENPIDTGIQFETDATLTLKDGILSVNTTNQMEQDNTLPITSAGVYATVGNIEALLKTI